MELCSWSPLTEGGWDARSKNGLLTSTNRGLEPPSREENCFERHLGTSPRRLAMELWIHRAVNLIVETEQSATETAMASGFGSPSHFSRVLRATYSVSTGTRHARPT